MERNRQKRPGLITMEDWLVLAHPDTPPLPWIANDGTEVWSFTVTLTECGITVVLYDAHGREVVRSATECEYRAIRATAIALGGKNGELTFLPVTIGVLVPLPGDE